MRTKTPALIITFASTTAAMSMEKYCTENELPGRLIPVPREITAGCGLAWKTLIDEKQRFEQALAGAGIQYEAMQVVEMWG